MKQKLGALHCTRRISSAARCLRRRGCEATAHSLCAARAHRLRRIGDHAEEGAAHAVEVDRG